MNYTCRYTICCRRHFLTIFTKTVECIGHCTVQHVFYESICAIPRPSLLSICLSVCLSVFLFVCLLPVCLYVYLSVCRSVSQSVSRSVYPSICLQQG